MSKRNKKRSRKKQDRTRDKQPTSLREMLQTERESEALRKENYEKRKELAEQYGLSCAKVRIVRGEDDDESRTACLKSIEMRRKAAAAEKEASDLEYLATYYGSAPEAA